MGDSLGVTNQSQKKNVLENVSWVQKVKVEFIRKEKQAAHSWRKSTSVLLQSCFPTCHSLYIFSILILGINRGSVLIPQYFLYPFSLINRAYFIV